MTREEIIRLANEAGFQVERLSVLDREVVEIWFAAMTKFAALVAKAEREECAKVCEMKGMVKGGEVFAAKIRARGQG